MESKYKHKVLIVDNNDQEGKIIGSILRAEEIEYIFAASGASALDKIKKKRKPFSLIICDQHLEDMSGIKVLEQANKLSQISIRFLMTDYSEIEAIIDAVNKGSIQRYIVKPLNHGDLIKAIRSGINLLENFLETEKLFKIAKQQNAKLYELDCELMEQTIKHNKTIHELNQDIEKITAQVDKQSFSDKPKKLPDKLVGEIEDFIKDSTGLDLNKTKSFFSDTIKDLHGKFKETANKNSFEMPGMDGESDA